MSSGAPVRTSGSTHHAAWAPPPGVGTTRRRPGEKMSWHARSRRATALEGLSVAATAHVRDVTPSGRCARDSAQAVTTSPGAGAAAVRSNEVTAPPPSVTGSDQTPPADRVTPAMSVSGMPRLAAGRGWRQTTPKPPSGEAAAAIAINGGPPTGSCG